VIVVDTSALMAVVLGEEAAGRCGEVLATEGEILVSAGTLAEALLLEGHQQVRPAMAFLIQGFGCQVVPVTEADAVKVANAQMRWGKGARPAGLNFGDCFAYALARERNCALLFVGNDFRRTDIAAAMSS